MSLESLIEAARDGRPTWSAERAGKVLASSLARREARAGRARIARRTGAALLGATAIVVVLLRGGAAPAGASTGRSVDVASPSADEAVLASVDRAGDGGYERD